MTRRVGTKKLALLVAMSIFGLWASTMVLVVYYTLGQQLPACKLPTPGAPITVDCQAVLSSPYSSIFGVPLELLAVFYFIINLAFIYMISFGPDRLFRTSFRSLFIWRFVGLAMVPYLLFIELGILKAICIYCTMMHIAIIVDFGIISYLLFYKKGIGSFGPPDSTGSQASTMGTGQEPISVP